MRGCFVVLLWAVVCWKAQAQYMFGGMGGMGSCFGVSTYNAASKTFCCKGNSYPAGPDPNSQACCGKHLASRTGSLCCSNDVFPKGPDMKCCDKTYINVKTQICCDGEPLFRMEGARTLCCGKKAYSPVSFTCCNSDLIPTADAKHNLACTPGNDADQIVNNQAPASPHKPMGGGHGHGAHGHGHGPGHPPHGHPPQGRPPHGHPAHGPPRPPPHGHGHGGAHNVFVHGPPPAPFPHRRPPPPPMHQPLRPPPPAHHFRPGPPPPPSPPAAGGGSGGSRFDVIQLLKRLMSRHGAPRG